MPEQPYIFQQGVNRLENAPVESLRDIRNARLRPFGDVQALPETETYAGDDPGAQAKPWLRDPSGSFLQPGTNGDDEAYEWTSGDRYRRYLYANRVYEAGAYRPHDFRAINNQGDIEKPPNMQTFSINEEDASAVATEYIQGAHYVHYVAVPFNARGEMGGWAYAGRSTSNRPSDESVSFRLTGALDDEVSRVEIYRTRQIPLISANIGGDPVFDGKFYYVGQMNIGVGAFGDPRGVLVDDHHWPYEIADEAEDPVGPLLQYPTLAYTPEKDINAQVRYNHAGVMVHGGVEWYTREPASGVLEGDTSGGSDEVDIAAQLEYETPNGKVYGPLVTYNDIRRATFIPQGEAAILIYVREGDGNFYEYERLSPDPSGLYLSQLVPSAGWVDLASMSFTWDSWNDNGQQTSTQPRAETEIIDEPDAAFLSLQNTPFSVTFNGFNTPDGSAIRALAGARQAEEESLQAYDFYVFSETGSWVASRDGMAVYLDHLIPQIGIALSPEDAHPLVTGVPQGAVFVGTDGWIHLVNGRQTVKLDWVLQRQLWTTVYDLEYDNYHNEVVVVSDTGIWFFNLDQETWSAHIDDEARLLVRHDGALLVRLGDDSYVSYDHDSEADIRTDAVIETQPVETVRLVKPDALRADYDPIDGDTNAETTLAGYNRFGRPFTQTFPQPPYRPRYPRVRGRNLTIRLVGFGRLRSLVLDASPVNAPF